MLKKISLKKVKIGSASIKFNLEFCEFLYYLIIIIEWKNYRTSKPPQLKKFKFYYFAKYRSDTRKISKKKSESSKFFD